MTRHPLDSSRWLCAHAITSSTAAGPAEISVFFPRRPRLSSRCLPRLPNNADRPSQIGFTLSNLVMSAAPTTAASKSPAHEYSTSLSSASRTVASVAAATTSPEASPCCGAYSGHPLASSLLTLALDISPKGLEMSATAPLTSSTPCSGEAPPAPLNKCAIRRSHAPGSASKSSKVMTSRPNLASSSLMHA